MPIKNNCSKGSPSVKINGGDENSIQKKPDVHQHFRAYFLLLVMCISFMWIAIAPVAAEDVNGSADFVSDLSPMLYGMADLMPAILALIIASIGVIIYLVGYQFVVGLLVSLLDGIRSAFTFKF